MHKKLIICFIFLLLMVGTAWADDEFSFRGTTWGMSKADVKKIEKKTLEEETHRMLTYDIGKVLGMEAICEYYFNDNDKLCMTTYGFESGLTIGSAKHIENYNKVKNTIIEKYGSPTSDEVIWYKEYAKDYYANDLDGALNVGSLELKTVWSEYKNALITIGIAKHDIHIYICVYYFDWDKLEEIGELMINDNKAENDKLF